MSVWKLKNLLQIKSLFALKSSAVVFCQHHEMVDHPGCAALFKNE